MRLKICSNPGVIRLGWDVRGCLNHAIYIGPIFIYFSISKTLWKYFNI